MGLLERLRAQPGFKDDDPKVRRAAVRALADPALLAELARGDSDAAVRDEATGALLDIALKGADEAAGLVALAALGDPKQIVAVARSAAREAVSRAALGRLTDLKALGSVARHGEHAAVRLEAIGRISDPVELEVVALKSPHKDAALQALERIASEDPSRFDPGFLATLAGHAKCPAAVHRARAILHERAAADGARSPELQEADRRKQMRLCEQVESLARSVECEPLAVRIAMARNAWTDLLPHVDDDLHERFSTAVHAARARLLRNQTERAERERLERETRALHEKYLAPRLTLCEAVETASAEDAPRALDDARWEWERLQPVDNPDEKVLADAAALAGRFEAACAECQARHERFEKEQSEALLSAQEQAARDERARKRTEMAARQKESAARLNALCERAARLAGSETLTLRKAEPAFREIRAALDAMPPLPSKREHHALLERLRAAANALGPRVKELRESERWKRWANTNVQEDLCARAEELREVADPLQASRLLAEIQDLWKTASAASKDKAESLWIRFKTASEEVRSRLEAHQAERATGKRALCEQAETLSGQPPAGTASTEWIRTAGEIKRLQAEWKTIGSASRADEKALWERFRVACDRFFARRDEDLAQRKEEWARNLERKEALCARAEALTESTDWKTTAAEIKRLQAEWKTIGPVRKSRSEAIWRRFHGACDSFFERYKRRDEIELARSVAAREGILREIEILAPAATPSQPAPEAPAGASEPAAAPPAGNLLETLRGARRKWQEAAALPPQHAVTLEERFDGALRRALEAFPAVAKGSEFDVAANQRKLEDLCARVERLLPQAGAGAPANLSPAARLAAEWREALATNTIGGKQAGEAKLRAAAEEAKQARAAWLRVGYVPQAALKPLAERFERACTRLPAPSEAGLADRSRGAERSPRAGRSSRNDRTARTAGPPRRQRPSGSPSGSA